nr:hypothetical protein KXZ65_01400 [Pectobacterium sp. PL152]
MAQLEKVASNAAEAVQYPSLDILGIKAGDTGKKKRLMPFRQPQRPA